MATQTKLVIEGDLVTKITVESGKDYDGNPWEKQIRGKTVNVNAWLEKVMADRGEQWFAPALSDGRIVARKTKGSREVVVVEFPPAVRRVIEKIDQSDERARQVAFPWTYLVVRFYNGLVDTMYVFYRNQAAEGLDAEVCLPNLPNVYGEKYRGDRKDYCICTGTISGMDASWDVSRKLNWLVQKFWDSQFNRDLIGEHWEPSSNLEGHPKSFADWEKRSKEDPAFILRINWRPLGQTIQQLLDKGVA
jgi:hypothetical protein